jgi:hypothetical protein
VHLDPAPLPRLVHASVAVLLALVAVVVASLFAAGAARREARLLDLVARAGTGSLSPDRVADAERVVGVGLAVWIGCYLLAGVLFAVWLRTAYRTAQALGVVDLRYGPWWAAVGWIVPIWHLWVPKRIVDDLWRDATDDLRYEPRPTLMWAWWTLFVVGLVGGRVDADTSGGFRFFAAVLLLDAVVAVLGGAVVVGIALRLAARSRRAGRQLPGSGVLRQAAVPVAPGAALVAVAVGVVLVGAATGVTGTAALPTGLAAVAAGPAPASDAPEAVFQEQLPFAVQGDGFTIAMPGQPVRSGSEHPSEVGTLTTVNHTYEDEDVLYSVSSTRFADDIVLDATVLLESTLDAAADAALGFGSPPESGMLDGRPWREALVTTESGNLRVRHLLDGQQLLELVAGPERLDEYSPSAQDPFPPFLASLRFAA